MAEMEVILRLMARHYRTRGVSTVVPIYDRTIPWAVALQGVRRDFGRVIEAHRQEADHDRYLLALVEGRVELGCEVCREETGE